MSLNDTVSAERVHIGFFGMRNAGKSSIVNAVTGQNLSVVSDVKGTTTDPVKKAMELLPMGPVVIIDTPGLDDEGELGAMRVEKAKQVLNKTDIAVLCVDATVGMGELDKKLVEEFDGRKIPYIIVYNKSDLTVQRKALSENEIYTSAANGENITELKNKIASLAPKKDTEKRLVADLLSPGDTVVLVIPIDESAPKGRLILPQQQTIRDILEAGANAVCCRDTELAVTLAALAKTPKMVITDSQAFGRVSKVVPGNVLLTSFSILFARYKGDLAELVKGASALRSLTENSKVLISKGCTHHRQCGDIGTVKMPAWIEGFCGAKPQYTFTSGGDYPEDLSCYDVIVHCGGCTLNEAEMQYRINKAKEQGTAIVNYGVAIAHMHGILKRSLEPFPHILAMLEE